MITSEWIRDTIVPVKEMVLKVLSGNLGRTQRSKLVRIIVLVNRYSCEKYYLVLIRVET